LNLQILQVLEPDELQRVIAGVARLTFADGQATASGAARAAKHNLQSAPTGPKPAEIDQIVLNALGRNREFQQFAIPKRLLIPTFARYTAGMEYGWHLDNAVMGAGDPLRTDLAATLFLSEPESYDGGELILDVPSGGQEIKLGAGEAVIYPATTIHRVAKVTRGAREVAVTWIQSAVRDERIRGILYDLARAHDKAEQQNDAEAAMLINKSYQNLLRYAADL
jgi:PKHD-type hydroxylase